MQLCPTHQLIINAKNRRLWKGLTNTAEHDTQGSPVLCLGH